MMLFIPLAQTLLTAVGMVQTLGNPAYRAACLSGACPIPPCRTAPMYTSSTASLGQPARSSAALIASEPSLGAEKEDRDPLNPPMGVLAQPTMTTSLPREVEYLLRGRRRLKDMTVCKDWTNS